LDPALAEARFERDIAGLTARPDVFEKVGIKLVMAKYPVLEVELYWRRQSRWIRLHVDATDYDYLPPKGWWKMATGSDLLQGSGVPSGIGFQVGGDPHTGRRPWFCFAGWREYHDWENHHQVLWPAIRRFPRHRLLAQVRQLHKDLNRAEVTVA
jgi:hypothetical protein